MADGRPRRCRDGRPGGIGPLRGAWRPGEASSYPFAFDAPWGPLTYRGRELTVAWYVQAHADLPWAFDQRAALEWTPVAPAAPDHARAVSLGPRFGDEGWGGELLGLDRRERVTATLTARERMLETVGSGKSRRTVTHRREVHAETRGAGSAGRRAADLHRAAQCARVGGPARERRIPLTVRP